ncbi:hypothetical protein LBMAG53_28690 [Planctomycetota bacterium]|nr:hypothetical protein LBMAG53_28690 [Planctomycetota bacterium]
MAEDAKDKEKKPAADAKAAKPAAAAGGGVIGPLLAGVVLLALGIGSGLFIASFFTPPTVEADAKGEGHGKADEHKEAAHESILHTTGEVNLGELRSNVSGQGGKRYIVMNCYMRMPVAVQGQLETEASGGGGHGGGGADPGASIKRTLQSRFEEHLKQYQLDELTAPTINKRLEKAFADIADRELRMLMPELPKEGKIVQSVYFTGILVQ